MQCSFLFPHIVIGSITIFAEANRVWFVLSWFRWQYIKTVEVLGHDSYPSENKNIHFSFIMKNLQMKLTRERKYKYPHPKIHLYGNESLGAPVKSELRLNYSVSRSWHHSGIPIFRASKGNEHWFEKSRVWEIGVKITVSQIQRKWSWVLVRDIGSNWGLEKTGYQYTFTKTCNLWHTYS